MLRLQEAIKKIIERFIVNITPVSTAISAGAFIVPIQSSRRYEVGDEVVIYSQAVLNATGEGEIRIISCIPDTNSIQFCDALLDPYPADTSFVQKLVDGKFLEGVYIGDPAKISHYPAITINATTMTNEWLTLTSITKTYNIDITVFTKEADYESSYRAMHTYIEKIEEALFRSLYPLAAPFTVGILAEPVAATDTVIRLVQPQPLHGVGGYIFLENWDFTRHNRLKSILDIDEGIFAGSPM